MTAHKAIECSVYIISAKQLWFGFTRVLPVHALIPTLLSILSQSQDFVKQIFSLLTVTSSKVTQLSVVCCERLGMKLQCYRT